MKAVYYGQELWQSVDYDKNKYGIPELKKYPMPDREHVKSAIRFFNYVEPQYEKELAKNIIQRIKEYHMTDISVGPDNRFGKYWHDNSLKHCVYYATDPFDPDEIAKHHGIIGQKWGIRRYQYDDGSLTPEGRARYGKGTGRRPTDATVQSGKKLNYRLKKEEYEDRMKQIEDDAKKVNGGLSAALFAQNRDNNCAYCTTAYELRRRGYDVKAAEAIVGVDLFSHPDLMFKGAKANQLIDVSKYKKDKNGNTIVDKDGNPQISLSEKMFGKGISKQQFNDIEKELVKQGDGARGNIFGTFAGSAFAGHSMAYEIVNGKLCIIDAQIGSVHDGSSIMKSAYQDLQNFRELYYTRTDNLQINDELIGNFVTDASVKSKVDKTKVTKDILAIASWFVPGAGLAYYALSAGDAIKNADKTREAYENVKKRGY